MTDDDNPFRHERPNSTEGYLESMWDTLQEVLHETRATNGRVTTLEAWRLAVDADLARKKRDMEVYEKGVADAPVFGPKQWKVIVGVGTVAGATATAAGAVVNFWT